MTPPRDRGPTDGDELVATIIPLRRREVEPASPDQNTEPAPDIVDEQDDDGQTLGDHQLWEREHLQHLSTEIGEDPVVQRPEALLAPTRLGGRRFMWLALCTAVVALAAVAALTVIPSGHTPDAASHHSAARTTTTRHRVAGPTVAQRASDRARARRATALAAKRTSAKAAARAPSTKAGSSTQVPTGSVTPASSPSSPAANPCSNALPGALGC
jgi:hypothetical protein